MVPIVRTAFTRAAALLCAFILLALLLAGSPDGGAEETTPSTEPVRTLSASQAEFFAIKASTTTTSSTTTTTTVPPTTTTTAPPPPVTTSTTAAPAPPPAPATGSCGGWEDTIAAYFPADQVAKGCAVIGCETGYTYDPTKHNPSSTASGLWQFLDRTWEDTTGTPAPAANYSADTQTAAAAQLWRSSGWSQWSCA